MGQGGRSAHTSNPEHPSEQPRMTSEQWLRASTHVGIVGLLVGDLDEAFMASIAVLVPVGRAVLLWGRAHVGVINWKAEYGSEVMRRVVVAGGVKREGGSVYKVEEEGEGEV